MIDVAIAIDGESYPLKRGVQTGAFDKPHGGKWVAGEPIWSDIRGAIQPAKGVQMQDLPEGLRAEARWLLWSRSEVLLNDLIKDGAICYRVMFIWPRREGGFTRAACGYLK